MEYGELTALGIALAAGLLVGSQREWSHHYFAGVRTFPLITLLGAVSGLLLQDLGAVFATGALLAVTAIVLLGNYLVVHSGRPVSVGVTTETAALLMYAVGVCLGTGRLRIGLVITGVAALLLHWKRPMHRFVRNLDAKEFRAISQFVLAALVVLPVLPDRSMGWMLAINPRRIGLLVTLIIGISVAAYLAFRVLGPRRGGLAAGALGGLVSSTAVTVSYARRARQETAAVPSCVMVLVIASAVVPLRVLVEVAAVSPAMATRTWPPLVAFTAAGAGLALISLAGGRGRELAVPEMDNPAQARTALAFGAFYLLVHLAVSLARHRFGLDGLYPVAGLTGLANVDAITVSTAELFRQGSVDGETAWRLLLLALLSNLLFKTAVAWALGGIELALRILGYFSTLGAAGAIILWLWPG